MKKTVNLQACSLFEVTGHARGGQGMVTAFEILAKIFSYSGEYQVQAFPAFGVERTGAPIQGFLRISKNPILNRSNIYNPNLIVVFDESLLGQVPVFDGLRENGIVVLNTGNKPEIFQDKASVIYTVAATKISLDKKLGSRSLPIVNSAMIGAMIKVLAGDIEIAKAIIREEVPAKPAENAEAAEVAFNSVNEWISPIPFRPVKQNGAVAKAEVTATPYWTKPMSLNKTGNWRLSIPIYVTRQAPCMAYCPAGTDVRGFVNLAEEKKFDDAYELLYERNPFPSLCGRECARYCEQRCNRDAYDGSLNVSAIESFLGDRGNGEVKPREIKYTEKIAVLGSGPGCLTAALRLRRRGYHVTVYEPGSEAGGILRKPGADNSVLDREIAKITDEGVEIQLQHDVSVDSIPGDFSAVIMMKESMPLEKNVHGVAIFSSGDLNQNGRFVESIGNGNETARQVHAYLRKEKYAAAAAPEDIVEASEMKFHYYDSSPKNKELNYSYESAGGDIAIAQEASRCLHCGSCFNCGNCYNFCPDALVYFDNKNRLRIDYEYCKGCGICFHECPSSAMNFDIIKKARQKE